MSESKVEIWNSLSDLDKNIILEKVITEYQDQ
jgi:hypothetical protein